MDFTSLIGLASILCEALSHRTTTTTTANLRHDVTHLQRSINDVKAIRDDLKKQIQRDELEGRSCSHRAKEWLNSVQAAETQTNSVLDKFTRGRQRRRYLCCFRPCGCVHYKLREEVSAALKNVDELKERAGEIKTDGGVSHELCKEIPIRSSFGITSMVERICGHLVEDETGIIGIYGPGGIGKTTLLQNINNEMTTKFHEYVVIWVTMSREFALCTIQQAVGTRLGLSWDERESGEQRALRIYRAMKQMKFLLLLDDVWEEIDFEKVGIPRPEKRNKSKVIFTTRSMALCSVMGAEQRLKMEYLGKEDSWQLFCNKVGRKDLLESPSIRPFAEIIVNKCGGLPLALITLGRSMAHRETEEEWIYATEVLQRSPNEVRGMTEVFTLLKFSYDNLESNLLRACFLYCAIFPEEYSIEIEQLVEYWIGEEFLTSSNGVNAIYKGYALIGDLKAACLLEPGDERRQVKMHNVLRSFALWMVSEEGADKELILVEPSMDLTEAPKAEKWRRAYVVSLMDNRITTLPDKPICPILATLMLQRNINLKKIPKYFFMHMPDLRVLDLSFTSLTEIPSSIEHLVELCYLSLSGTKLSALPVELGTLKKLKHLDLQRTQLLQTIPRNAISRLSKLEILNLYYSYAGWELQTFEPDEEELGFSHLEHLKNLTTLGITVLSLHTLNMLQDYRALNKYIQYLHIEECHGLPHLNISSELSRGLRRLSIKSCHDLEYLVVSTEAESDCINWLSSLEVLTLHSLHNLIRVWQNPVNKESLQNIRCVNISCCHKLKSISWLLQLSKLEIIDLFDCRELEELISEQERSSVEDPASFSNLKTLSMRNLPELRSILPSQFSFPKLETLAIANCPKIKKLPFLAKMQTKLPTVYGNKTWWDSLDRDELHHPDIEILCLPQS